MAAEPTSVPPAPRPMWPGQPWTSPLLAWIRCHRVHRGEPIGPDAPAPARRHDDHRDGGLVRGVLWHSRRQSLLRPTPAPADLAGPPRRRRQYRLGGHCGSDRLRGRAGAHRSPGGHPDPASVGARDPVGGRGRALGRRRRTGHRRSPGGRLHRRPVFGGSPDTGALRCRTGIRPAARTGGGHGDERAASRDPAGTRPLRGDRRRRRFARGVCRCRRDGLGARRSPQPPAAERGKASDPGLLSIAQLGCPSDAHPALAPPAGCHRRPGVRHLQCDLDQPGLLARSPRPTTTAWR